MNKRRSNKAIATICLAFVLMAACSVPIDESDAAQEPESVKTRSGLEIAQMECASCHAIGATGASSHPEALEFRRFSRFYPIEDLAEALAEGIYVGHPDMPVFRFEPDEVGVLIDYIQSIQEPIEL